MKNSFNYFKQFTIRTKKKIKRKTGNSNKNGNKNRIQTLSTGRCVSKQQE